MFVLIIIIFLVTYAYVKLYPIQIDYCITHVHVAVPLRRSTGSEIGLLRPPPLVTSSAHTFTVSPSPKVLLVVEFASWITAPEINHNHGERNIPHGTESTNFVQNSYCIHALAGEICTV